MLWCFVLSAFGRDVLRDPRARPSDEMFFVLVGPTFCPMSVVVAADGVPLGAKAEGCPSVLAPTLERSMMRWRWAPAADSTFEQVEIAVRAPAYGPRQSPRDCLTVATISLEGRAGLLSSQHPACAMATSRAPAREADPAHRNVAWCELDVTVDRSGEKEIHVLACAEGYDTVATAAVGSWIYGAEGHWRMLVGFERS